MKTLLASVLLAAAGVHAAPSLGAGGGPPSSNVAWQAAASDADIDRAFAQARAAREPVLLYWGATWCPPCNQLKATLFDRQDFAMLARSFVAVHVDGDRPGAQRLGQRFKVTGYPTTVLYRADGEELTRLPAEVDAVQALAVLRLGLAGGRPARAVLADARTGKPLAATEWQMLAFYSWDTDDEQLVPRGELPAVLTQLAVASTAGGADAETTMRLWLKTLAASSEGQGVKADAALRARVLRLLGDPAQARLQMDVLSNSAPEIVLVLDGTGSRPELIDAFDAALRRLQGDSTLSRADRLQALIARIELARLDEPKAAVQVSLPAPLLRELRTQVARDEREISNAYERQAVITQAGYALGRAGLWADSDALLKAEVARSASPYYQMSQLAGNARKLGHTDEALRWSALAWDKSVGPATRLQWGAAYLGRLVDLAPTDAPRIEKTAARIFDEAARDEGALQGRSVRSLKRVGAKLAAWASDGKHAGALRRLQTHLDALCARSAADAAAASDCRALLRSAVKESA